MTRLSIRSIHCVCVFACVRSFMHACVRVCTRVCWCVAGMCFRLDSKQAFHTLAMLSNEHRSGWDCGYVKCNKPSFLFSIFRPRLGVILHRVVGVGLIYFVLASIEGCTRALQPRNSSQNQVGTQPSSFAVHHPQVPYASSSVSVGLLMFANLFLLPFSTLSI